MALSYIKKEVPVTSAFYGTLSDTSDADIIIENGTSANSKLVTLNIYGADLVSGVVKNSLIVTKTPRSKDTQKTEATDLQTTKLLNLKRIDENYIIKGWLDDGLTYTAWQKLWIIRAMVTSGNLENQGSTLKECKIGDITFSTNNIPLLIERLFWKLDRQVRNIEDPFSNSSGEVDVNTARIEISLDLITGVER